MASSTLAVQWNRFGPYHRARLNHLHTYAAERGIRIVAIETAPTDSLYSWKVGIGKDGFEHHVLFPDRDYGELSPALIRSKMASALDELGVDGVAIQSYSLPGARACLSWCRTNQKTAILMNVSREQDAERVGWREEVKSILLSQFDSALLSGSQASDYATKLGFPSEFIFSGCTVIDNDHFKPTAESLPLEDRSGGFLVSSRFMPRKNLLLLVEAYSDYRTKSSDPWPLKILGDGKLRSKIEKVVKELNLDAFVELPGFCDYESLPSHFSKARCFIHPAENDQWALVVNEAMAAGLPVLVSTGAGCHVELVDEGKNGFVFEPGDKTRLTELMFDVSTSRNISAMGDHSLEYISEWNLDRFSRRMIEAFEAGKTRSRRGKSLRARAVFSLLNILARDARSFHTVDS